MSGKKGIDLWLERLSYIAQIGLLIGAAFTINYTVIPLYQLASLQESIAIKEVEFKEKIKEIQLKQIQLDQMEVKANNFYKVIRKDYINKYITIFHVQCDPIRSMLLNNNSDKKSTEERAIEAISVDINTCVNDEKFMKEMSDYFTEKDFSLFKEKITQISQQVEKKRQETLNNIKTYRKRATIDPSILPKEKDYSKDSFVENLDRLMISVGVDPDSLIDEKYIMDSRINDGLWEEVKKYADDVYADYSELRDINWM
ncbi:hypothetical protein [Limnobaculum xujianqingii]|uniref:hypothetical protein n=1 Tax=Limnobaculum xujianqingii TaxID=2738837 RepID=UPI0011298483|nr:hypothetical protein [Limnobaculum xujianqingii]